MKTADMYAKALKKRVQALKWLATKATPQKENKKQVIYGALQKILYGKEPQERDE